MLVWIVVIVVSIFADQLTKQLVVNFLDKNEPFELIPGVFRFTYVENRGAAFGMLDDKRWVFMIISTVAIIGLFVYMWKFCRNNKMLSFGLSLIIGGGIGNMIDRVVLGYVIDFIDFCAFPKIWMWVFNVADTCVCVGAGMVVLSLLIDICKDARVKKKDGISTETEVKENKE
jgi:signal peptidase II